MKKIFSSSVLLFTLLSCSSTKISNKSYDLEDTKVNFTVTYGKSTDRNLFYDDKDTVLYTTYMMKYVGEDNFQIVTYPSDYNIFKFSDSSQIKSIDTLRYKFLRKDL